MVGVPSMSRFQSVQPHEQDVAEAQHSSHLGGQVDGGMPPEKGSCVRRPLGSLVHPVEKNVWPHDPLCPVMPDVTRYSQCHRLKNERESGKPPVPLGPTQQVVRRPPSCLGVDRGYGIQAK